VGDDWEMLRQPLAECDANVDDDAVEFVVMREAQGYQREGRENAMAKGDDEDLWDT